MAERVGFEPTDTCMSAVFKPAAAVRNIGRSFYLVIA